MSEIPIKPKLLLLVMASVFGSSTAGAAPLELVSLTNAVWRFNQSSNLDNVTWSAPAYDDSNWEYGTSLLGFEDNANLTPLIRAPLNAPSVAVDGVAGHAYYFRIHFDWPHPPSNVTLQFTCRIDDCAVFYLNGVLLTNAGVTEPVTFASLGRGAIGTGTEAIVDEVFSVLPTSLVTGDNVLAVEVHQTAITSSDVVFGAQVLGEIDETTPALLGVVPLMGSSVPGLNSIGIDFTEPVLHVDAADLLVNNQPATNLVAIDPARYIFGFAPPATGQVQVAFASGHGIADRAGLAFAGANWTYTLDPSQSAKFELAGTLYVDLRATNNSAGTAVWVNEGALGDFTRVGSPVLVQDVLGTGIPALLFNGSTDYFLGPSVPSDIIGANDFSVEVWTLNPDLAAEETIVSWGRRGATRINNGLNFGSHLTWGCATYFNDDLGWGAAANIPSAGLWHHLVLTYNGGTLTKMHVDGVMRAQKTLGGVLATESSYGLNIGCQRNNDGSTFSFFYSGYLNSVRIHGGLLSDAQIANNYAVGPAVRPNTGPVVITRQPQSVTVSEGASVSFSVVAGGSAPIGYQWFRNGAPIPGATGKSIDLRDVEFGDNGSSFFVVVSNYYAGSSATAVSDTANLAVVLAADALRHRYAFDSDANDQVGAAHGQLVNGASVAGGEVWLNGINQYVNLPNNLVTGYQSVTFETWVTDLGSAASARVFDFGNSTAGEDFALGAGALGTRYLSLFLPDILGNLRGACSVDGAGAEQPVQWEGGRPPAGPQAHVVWTLDGPAQRSRLYVNGALVGMNDFYSLNPATIGPTLNNWLGRSQANAPLFLGSIAEFRIYATALSSNLVVRNFIGGPDQPPGNGPVGFITQPNAATVFENELATFSALLNGTQPFTFQWYRNGAPVAGATNRTLSFVATLADARVSYRLWATNVFENSTFSAGSDSALLTVTADTTPPLLVRAGGVGSNLVEVIFSEPVAEESATDLANYSLTGPGGLLGLVGATLEPGGNRVVLATAPLLAGATYTLSVQGLQDRAATPNLVPLGSQAAFVVVPYELAEVNEPAPAGALLGGTNGVFLTGGGADIGGAADQFTFANEMRTGDFDVQVWLQSLSPVDVWTKAGLMARESLAAGSRFAAVLSTPSMAGTFFQFRATNNQAASTAGSFPANFPASWLRLKREGNSFSGYASFDGLAWTLLGSVNMALSNTLHFGICLASHQDGVAATAQFADLGPVTSVTVGVSARPNEPLGPSSRRTGLTISEIMYRPRPRADGRILEYIEIYNSNPFFHDIGGYRVSADIDFTFPSGTIIPAAGYIVVAANPADLQAVHGLAGVYGPYTNRLQTSGTIRLRDEQDAILLELTYSNASPWPASADGTGHSIVLARPSYGEGNPRAWAASDVVGGSPGTPDAWRPGPLRNIVINEILANSGDRPTGDYLELYNHSNQEVDLSGCILSDNPSADKFRIPADTRIAPRGFLAFHQNQLGFGFKAGGDTAYFKDPGATRVLDAIRFEAQAVGVSLGRWPDGAAQLYPLASQTPAATNGTFRVSDIVINEIMYHPISNDPDDQFVELHNLGTNAVDLGGWRFVDGVTFTFAPGTTIPSGGYVAVARNLTNLLAHYGNLNSNNAVGNFDGRLSFGGERLALARPQINVTTNAQGLPETNVLEVVVDEVTYADGGRWGEWADGGGSSLELVDPHANHRWAANWADSDETAKAPWTTIEAAGVLDNGSNHGSDPIGFVQLGQLDPGECLIDDLEVLPVAGTPNYVANPDFNSGLSSWSLQGCFSRSVLAPGVGFGGSGNALRLRTANRLFTIANSAQGTLNNTSLAVGQTATLRFKARWLKGCPEILMRLAGNWLEAAGSMSLPTNLGTPGARNSRALTNASPALHDVTHFPSLPAENESVLVTASVHDPDGVTNLVLQYRVDPSVAYVSLPMADDGTVGDAVAGDGIFSAAIPGQSAGATVAFVITAADARGAAARFPALLNDGGPDRECIVRWGEPDPAGAFGTYHIWLTQTNVNRWMTLPVLSNEDIDGTMVYNSRVIYNMKARYAGSPYHQAFDGPAGNRACHYNLDVPSDDKLLGHASFNKLHWIGNDIQDDNATSNNNDSTLQREQTACTLLRGLGQPWVYRRYVAVYVNGVRRGQLMEDALRPSVSVPDEYLPDDPDGYLYKVQPWFEGGAAANADTTWPWQNKSWAFFIPYTTTGGAYKQARYRWCYQPRQAPDRLNNFSNFFDLVTIGSSYLDPNWAAMMEQVADMENWLRLMAANHAAGNWDCWGIQNGQNIYAYQAPNTKWTLFMFDFSIVLGNRISWAPGTNLEAIPAADTTWQYIYGAGTGKPVFRRMYWRALKELVSGPMAPGAVEPLLDAKYAAFKDSGIVASSPQAIKDWIAAARSSIASQVASRDTSRFTVATNWVQAVTNIAILSGTAPLEVSTLLVGDAAWPVTWSSTVAWRIDMPVVPGTNTFTVVGLDHYGNPVSGASNVVTVANPVAPEPVDSQVVISEIMFSPLVPDAEFVELFNLSSNVAFDLSGWQFNGLSYTFAPGSLIFPQSRLVLVKNRGAYASAFGALAPVFDVFEGNLQGKGETISLIQPGANPAEGVVIDRVRYESEVPWPGGATNGTSLQLLDPLQDNSRVSNWSDGVGWRYASFEGNSAGATASRLAFYLESTGGDVYLDDVSLVLLSGPNAGSNLLRNAGFELPLGGANNWVTSAVTVASAVVTNLSHSGNSCLSFSMRAAPALPNYFYQNLPFSIPAQTPCVLGFWYLPGSKGTNLSAYLNSNFRPSADISPPKPATPGMPNSVAAVLPPFPSLWLNEVYPHGQGGVLDSQGEAEPWIELFNPGDAAISLDGLHLSDNYVDQTAWAFPNGSVIAPGQFLVVVADGEPGESIVGEVHAGFRLSGTNGSVVLARVNGDAPQILDYLNYAGLRVGYSYGAFPDGQPFYRQVLSIPSPRAANGSVSWPVVRINEWMADNSGLNLIFDPADGRAQDWFELFNPNANPVDIDRWFLSDSLTNRLQFEVRGRYVIPPGGYLWVWADNQTDQNLVGSPDLHVNFKLDKEGDAIVLSAPDGSLVDAVVFGPQSEDIAEGRTPDGGGLTSVLAFPTPRTANTAPPPSPRFLGLTVEPSSVAVTLQTVSNFTYRVEFLDALGTTNWLLLWPPQRAPGSTLTVPDDFPMNRTRFYRAIRTP